MKIPKALFNWSSGKDSALALYKILKSNTFEVACLFTSINEEYQRISMHGVHVSLLEQQALSIGIPLISHPLKILYRFDIAFYMLRYA